jgi:hypothetical protein
MGQPAILSDETTELFGINLIRATHYRKLDSPIPECGEAATELKPLYSVEGGVGQVTAIDQQPCHPVLVTGFHRLREERKEAADRRRPLRSERRIARVELKVLEGDHGTRLSRRTWAYPGEDVENSVTRVLGEVAGSWLMTSGLRGGEHRCAVGLLPPTSCIDDRMAIGVASRSKGLSKVRRINRSISSEISF